MTISGTVDPSTGAYTPPAGASLTIIQNDINILQSNYTTAKTQLDAAYSAYANALLDLQAKQAALESAFIGGNTTTISAAKTALQTSVTNFTAQKNNYESKANATRVASLELTNARYSYQTTQDNLAYTSLNSYINSNQITPNLQSTLDSTEYAAIQNSFASYAGARSTLASISSTFQNNEIALENSRYNALVQNDALYIQKANLTIANGIPPSSNPGGSSPWNAYFIAQSTYNNLVSTINTVYLPNRSSYENTLQNSISNYQSTLTGAPNGLVTLLNSTATTYNQNAVNYSTNVTNALNATQSLLTSTLTQTQTLNQQIYGQYYLNFPSQNSAIDQQVAATNSGIQSLINAVQTNQDPLQFLLGNNISLPSIQGGGAMSMADLMRFISNAQLNSQNVRRFNRQSDLSSNIFRMRLWELIFSQINSEVSARLQYLATLTAQDVTFNKANQDAYRAQLAFATSYANQRNIINTRIQQINTTNARKTSEVNNIVQGFNNSAIYEVGTINSANTQSPNAINTNDLFNQDPDRTSPTLLPNPQLISTPPAYPTFTTPLPNLPTVPTTLSSQAQIDAYNNTLTTILTTLGALSSAGENLSPSIPVINLPQVDLLSYRPNVPVRDINSLYNFNSIYASLNALSTLISEAASQTSKSTDDTSTKDDEVRLDVFGRKRFAKPLAILSNSGSGTSLVSSDQSVSLGKLGQVLNNLVSSSNYGSFLKNIIDEATTLASLSLSVRPTTELKTKSTLGLFEDDKTNIGRSEEELQNLQLGSVAQELLATLNNKDAFLQNALLLIAGSQDANQLTPDELLTLIGQLVFTQQITLLLLAAQTLASIGINGDLEQLKQNILDLIAKGQGKIILEESLASFKDEGAKNELKELLKKSSALTTELSRENLAKEAAKTLERLGVNNKAVSQFNEAINQGQTFYEAVNQALSPPASSNPFTGIFESSAYGQAPSAALGSIIGSVFSQNGASFTQNQINSLDSSGFTLPSASANSPEFIQELLDQAEQIAGDNQKEALRQEVANQLTGLGASQTTIERYFSDLSLGESLGKAVSKAFSKATGDLIDSLNVNLDALNEQTRKDLANQAEKSLGNLDNLTTAQKLKLTLAISAGQLSPVQASQLANVLAEVLALGGSGRTLSRLAAVLEPLSPAQAISKTGDAFDTRTPSTMPKTLVQMFQEHTKTLQGDKQAEKIVDRILESFAETISTQKDFYKFSLSFLLDPANSFLKNFSIFTAEKGKGGQQQTSTQIAV